ncbi:MAG: Ig-like domain-containing protein, partial [Anaerolineae bacterium]
YYDTGLPGEFDTSLSIRAFYKIDLSDLNQDPHADDGLVISVVLKGGLNGIKGADGSLLRKDYSWKYFTTPTLSPRVIAAQGGESTNLLAGRPGVIRVEAGLGEDTELDYVDAEVYLSYGTQGDVSRASHRFYPDPLTGPLEAKLTGNSANFYSRKGEVPILPDGRGTHLARAEVTPVDQQGITIPREYVGSATLRMRVAASDYVPFEAHIHPIRPTGPYCMDEYTWYHIDTVPGLNQKPVMNGARASLERMLPLRTPVEVRTWVRLMDVLAPKGIARGCKYMLPGLLKSYKYRGQLSDDAGLLLGPSEWIRNLNGGDRIFHDSVSNTCIAADDAPAETLAHCLGHAYASGDDVVEPVRGYDLERDRYVDTDHPVTGYSVGLMDRNLAQEASASDRVWIGTYTYGRMMEAFSGATTVAQSRSLAGDQSLVVPSHRQLAEGGVSLSPATSQPMAVGGLLVRETAVVSGMLDLIDWPATGSSLPAPEGTGAYELRLRDSGGAILASHPMSPGLGTLWDATPYVSFLYAVDAPQETNTVDLLHGAELLDTISASANPPTVTITQPTGGTYSGTLDLAWEGSDEDVGDTLEYYVYMSSDDGATWTPLSLGTTGISLTLESTEHPNGALCRFKVVASDGFLSATALSAPFAISNPPRVDWVWPADGSTTAGCYTEISAGFRDPMDAATIDVGTFTLVDSSGSPVSGTVTYEEAVRQATFTPAGALVYGQGYTATLDSAIEAEDGQTLGTAEMWWFRVERGPFGVMLPLVLNE